MKALVYRGPKDVRIENVPDAKLEEPTDCLVRITSTNICGSDLHMYEGRTSVEERKVLGHENLSVVVEVGDSVRQVKKGDVVCLPFKRAPNVRPITNSWLRLTRNLTQAPLRRPDS